ncbi:TPA: hypothetical protein N0F65_008540 [Lagenidium giganteum]|uniref:Vacuolar protein 8 n=1 Tax=Lagenidium giganteum TaxID=4803 RepID=A0AAV2YNS8_9STRA|nr:TPA: hypothetical protein N0F65_008540 [Lagenidium giganteum]
MGLSHSQQHFFGSPVGGADSDSVDVLQYLERCERQLWKPSSPWKQAYAQSVAVAGPTEQHANQVVAFPDPADSLSIDEAMELIPRLMESPSWVSPLVSLVGSMDQVVQVTALALLCKVVQSAEADAVFIKLSGMVKVLQLLNAEAENVRYAALELIRSICSRNLAIVQAFCRHGLIRQLTQISREDSDALTLSSLILLRLVLREEAAKSEITACETLPLLLKLTQSPNEEIARLAIICIGMCLPNKENLIEINRLSCVEALLRVMAPGNIHADAAAYALSLIADESDEIFPRELTGTAVVRMMETLRGSTKRTKTASAMAYLFASLAKSSIYHSSICTPSNLSILTKLLVGTPKDVLCATAFAIGTVALSAKDSVKLTLFEVDAPQSLVKLVAATDDLVRVMAIFAITTITSEAGVLDSCKLVFPDRESDRQLVQNIHKLNSSILQSRVHEKFCDSAITRLCVGSSFALQLLLRLVSDHDVKLTVCNQEMLQRLVHCLRFGQPQLVQLVLLFCLECSRPSDPGAPWQNDAFCALLELSSVGYRGFFELFLPCEVADVFGLPVLLGNCAKVTKAARAVVSDGVFIAHTMMMSTKVNHPVLHLQVLTLLDQLTQDKNEQAIESIFQNDPDRVANLLHFADVEIQFLASAILRRIFKRRHSDALPSTGAMRQLIKLLGSEDRRVAVSACRVWGNLAQFETKRQRLATTSGAFDAFLVLLQKCLADFQRQDAVTRKNLHAVIRTLYRSVASPEVRHALVAAPNFLKLVDLLFHEDEGIAHLALSIMCEITKTSALKKHVLTSVVMVVIEQILRDRDPLRGSVYKIDSLQLIALLACKDAAAQRLLFEFKIVDAVTLLIHSPVVALNWHILKEALEALAWLASADAAVRKSIASPKMVDMALKHVDSAHTEVAIASLHLLQRLSFESEVKNFVKATKGPTTIMRALNTRNDMEIRRKACSLIRNLVYDHEDNQREFHRLGVSIYLMTLLSSWHKDPAAQKLLIGVLGAIAALCEGAGPESRKIKQEILECHEARLLFQLVTSQSDHDLCTAWSHAMAAIAVGSSINQRRLMEAELVPLLVEFLATKDRGALQIYSAQILASIALRPENRLRILEIGGEKCLTAIIDALRLDVPDLQRFTALFVANVATRCDENKSKIGASGAISPLVDRLSSQQPNVLENVLLALVKLGNHAGNKVKLGSKVCFEKLLNLVHHPELAIRKGSVSTIAVLVEGNEVNKKFLLQCAASVASELCALMKSSNGKVVESAMLILGELSLIPEQTLEISKHIDVLAIVRMMQHINWKIKRAALNTVINLTKESFNKLRFGIQECIDALIEALKSDDLIIVELAVTCLANLSFQEENKAKIANIHTQSMQLLLRLANASVASKDYAGWKELVSEQKSVAGGVPGEDDPQKQSSARSPRHAQDHEEDLEQEMSASPTKRSGDADGSYALDFSSFPARQTVVVEQCMLIISNCAHEFHSQQLVDRVAIRVVAQNVAHPSELVKRCACFILARWCRKDPQNQELVTGQGILAALIQLVSSPNMGTSEAALYALTKLVNHADNHVKMMNLDLLNTVEHNILRRQSYMPYQGLLDRAVRLLGSLATFAKIRQNLRSEEIISDVLTSLLQLHRPLSKNISRLILIMLEEDSLRFFLPKKTLMLLRAVFTDDSTDAKAIRNILQIFVKICTVEEHKTTIALEDSGETLDRLLRELQGFGASENYLDVSGYPPNAITILQLLAEMGGTRRVASILHEKDVYRIFPRYIVPCLSRHFSETPEPETSNELVEGSAETASEHRTANLSAMRLGKHLCQLLTTRAVANFLGFNYQQYVIELLGACISHPIGASDGIDGDTDAGSDPLIMVCLTVFELLTVYAEDKNVMLLSGTPEILHYYLNVWIDRSNSGATDDNSLLFVAPIANVIGIVAMLRDGKQMLVRAGGIPLYLKALAVPHLTDEVREYLAQATSLLSELHQAIEWFDAQDLVSPLVRFMVAYHRSVNLFMWSLRALSAALEGSKTSRQHMLPHTQALALLLRCLDKTQDGNEDQVHFAVNALDCLSAEKELAGQLAKLPELPLAPRLLLVPEDRVTQETQFFATEMIGYMTQHGFVNLLQLEPAMISRIIYFADVTRNERVSTESIVLAMWTLARLIQSPSVNAVCGWLIDDPHGIRVLIQSGIMPGEFPVPSAVTAHVLIVLLALVTRPEWLARVTAFPICTPLARLLESVERTVRIPALQLLSTLLPSCEVVSVSKELWSSVFKHLTEWIEVYGSDPAACPLSNLSIALRSMSLLVAAPVLEPEIQYKLTRSQLPEILCKTIQHFDPLHAAKVESTQLFHDSEDALHRSIMERGVYLSALRICRFLMEVTHVHCEKFLELGIHRNLEEALQQTDAAVLNETLQCMRCLSQVSSETVLLFASLRCVARLRELLTNEDLGVVTVVVSLLLLMCEQQPKLPGLCCLEGIETIGRLVDSAWKNLDDVHRQSAYGVCKLLTLMFSGDENSFLLYDQARIIPTVFAVARSHHSPEQLLRLLLKLSNCSRTHDRFIDLLDDLCEMLADPQCSAAEQNLVLCVLFNMFCREEEAARLQRVLDRGAKALTSKLLPLSAWVSASINDSVVRTLKILRTYVLNPTYRSLFNDGANIPALLQLIRHQNMEIATSAAQVLLTIAQERDVQVAVTVEDGIAVLVRVLRQTSKPVLQGLLLGILSAMSHDSEIQVLILHEGGAARLVELISERNSRSFSSDDRLQSCVAILKDLSTSRLGAERLVEAGGHTVAMDLHKVLASEQQLVGGVAMAALQALRNMAAVRSVTPTLVAARVHVHFFATLLERDEDTWTHEHNVALAGAHSLVAHSKDCHRNLYQVDDVVGKLEDLLQHELPDVRNHALATLRQFSKSDSGRTALAQHLSRNIVRHVCNIIVTLAVDLPDKKSGERIPKAQRDALKLLARLLSHPVEDNNSEVQWELTPLTSLLNIFESVLSNHQSPKLQLAVIHTLHGAYARAFYFTLSSQMLVDLLNVVLISQSAEHSAHAEDVIVQAFANPTEVRASIGGNQILEQLLIVFAQKTEPPQRQRLHKALALALVISLERKLIVNQRFLAKILTLINAVDSTTDPVSPDQTEQELISALCAYLSYAYANATTTALQQSMIELLRSQVNSGALRALLSRAAALHAPLEATDVYIWYLLTDVLEDSAAMRTSVLATKELDTWLDIMLAIFRDVIESTPQTQSRASPTPTGTCEPVPRSIAIISSLRMLAFLANLTKAPSAVIVATDATPAADTDESSIKAQLCTCTLMALHSEPPEPALYEAALVALLAARDGWGEACVMGACDRLQLIPELLNRVLTVFSDPAPAWKRTRHLVLRWLLALVTTGHLIPELKASRARECLENNELIAPADKAFPITILSLLGYNPDLNAEFALALQRFQTSPDFGTRKDALSYLVTFLQLYAVTDEMVQVDAIRCFTKELLSGIAFTEPTSLLTESAFCFLRLAQARSFAEVYLQDWDLNALVQVVFCRKRGTEEQSFSKVLAFSLDEIQQLLEVVWRICAHVDPASAAAVIDDDTLQLVLAFALEAQPQRSSDERDVFERTLGLIDWLLANASGLDAISATACSLLPFVDALPLYQDNGSVCLTLLDKLARDTAHSVRLGDLVLGILSYLYGHVQSLTKTQRERLLLLSLVILKRMGDDSSANALFEESVQLILAHLHSVVEHAARVSWDLLVTLCDQDAAIIAIFNLDGIQALLKECTRDERSKRSTRTMNVHEVSSHSSNSSYTVYRKVEALKCLSKACRTHDEVLAKLGEAQTFASFLFRVLAQEREFVGCSGEAQAAAAHILSRLASQELLRAALLSLEHVTVLIEALESVHVRVVQYALEALFHLRDVTLCMDALVRHATVPVLAQVLHSPLGSGALAERTTMHVLGLLAHMSTRDKAISRRVVSSNLVPRLRAIVANTTQHSTDASVDHFAVCLVANIAKDGDLVTKLLDAHLLEALIEALPCLDPATTLRKAHAAMALLISAIEPSRSTHELDSMLRPATTAVVEALHKCIPRWDAQRAVGHGLAVLEAVATQSETGRHLLLELHAIDLAVQLLSATNAFVKLRALHTVHKWVEDADDNRQVRAVLGDPALLALVRVLTDGSDDALVVALALLNVLLHDDVLQTKLADMTHDVLLRLVTRHAGSVGSSTTGTTAKIVAEALKPLTLMTKTGKVHGVSTASAAVVESLPSLVHLVQGEVADGTRLNALFLLVNFASAQELRSRIHKDGGLHALLRVLAGSKDDKVMQLCLLGIALLTAVDFGSAVDVMVERVGQVVDCLTSRNPGVQANAVWVLSNFANEDRLRQAIIDRGGVTTLQAILSDTIGAESGSGTARPPSSSQRIREYAPKAIKSLGFTPLGGVSSTASPPPPPPPSKA